MSYSIHNSTFRALDSGDVFTGNSEPVDRHEGVHISFKADTETKITLEWSSLGSVFDFVDVYDNLVAEKTHEFRVHNRSKIFRLKIENISAADQTYLRLTTKFINNVPNDQYQIDTNLNSDRNVFSNYTLTGNEWSRSFDVRTKTIGCIFGSVSNVNATISVECSADNVNFYETGLTTVGNPDIDNYYLNPVGEYPVYLEITLPYRYIRFHVSKSTDISLTFSAK